MWVGLRPGQEQRPSTFRPFLSSGHLQEAALGAPHMQEGWAHLCWQDGESSFHLTRSPLLVGLTLTSRDREMSESEAGLYFSWEPGLSPDPGGPLLLQGPGCTPCGGGGL